jgi:thioester reductase-like protein
MIFHAYSVMDPTQNYSQLRDPHIQSTLTLLRLACEGSQVRPMYYVSTLSVFPAANAGMLSNICFEQDNLSGYQETLDFGYAQSKWVAERLVNLAGARGLPTCIFREGMITGHSSTGVGEEADYFSQVLQGFIDVGAVPVNLEAWDLTTVDYVTQAILALTCQETSLGKRFHLTNTTILSGSYLADCLNGFGYPIECVASDAWSERVQIAAQNRRGFPTELLLSVAVDDSSQLQYDCRNTLASLSSSGVVCPADLATLVTRYLSYFVSCGFIPPPNHSLVATSTAVSQTIRG